MNSSLNKLLTQIEGIKIDNIDIVNGNGQRSFSSFLQHHEFIFVVYQNGIVCDPCSDVLFEYWKNTRPKMSKLIYPDFITIGEHIDRKTQINYYRDQKKNTYFIDSKKTLKQEIIKSDFPVNFLFFVDKNLRIIYVTYFNFELKENILNFFEKANRYTKNSK